MQKKILVLIGVLLLIINIAYSATTFSKTEFLKRINKIIDKAATYTSITSTERTEYLKAADKFADATEKCMNLVQNTMVRPEIILNAYNEMWNSIEKDLDNQNTSASEKARYIRQELKEKKLLQISCISSGNGVDISNGDTYAANGNYSPVRKSYQCEIGQNIEGLCVYPLPSYKVSLDVAKRNCGNYGMTFATREQVNMLAKHGKTVYSGYESDSRSIFIDGTTEGMGSLGQYYTVLCVKDNNNSASTSVNYSPVRKSYQCEIGQNIEGLCVYPLPSYKVSLDVAKRNCGNYGMTFATREQVNMLAKHGKEVYSGYESDFRSIFIDGTTEGMGSLGQYYTVLCVKDNNNSASTSVNYSPVRKSY